MGMSNKLSREYFELVQGALKEERAKNVAPVRKKRRQNTKEHIIVVDSDDEKIETAKEPDDVIALDSSAESEDNLSVGNDDSQDEDFDSDDFEDVPMDNYSSDDDREEEGITFTIQPHKSEKSAKKRELNSVDKVEKKKRFVFHQIHLLALLVHGYQRNKILNNEKFHKKLDKLIPDAVFDLLHPKKDEEMPLRSTRKLLDGLKKAIEIWQNYYTCTYDYNHYLMGLYMRPWNKVSHLSSKKPSKHITEDEFISIILKNKAGSRDIGAQGFVALLRAVGLNARLVFSLQPPDFTQLKKIESNEKDDDLNLLLSSTSVTIVNKRIRKLDNGTRSSQSIQTKPENDITNLPVESLKYPLFWCEVWNKFNKSWITIDSMNFNIIEQHTMNRNSRSKLEPTSLKQACKFNSLRYVIGYDRKLGCRDITPRYTTQYHSKVFKKRCTRDETAKKWYEDTISYLNKYGGRTVLKIDDYEDEFLAAKLNLETIPDSLQDFSNHPKFILENQITSDYVLKDGCKHCGFFKLKNKNKSLKVYLKSDLLKLRSARQWYMEGRILKNGAQHLKIVKKRRFKPSRGDVPDEEDDGMERLYSEEATELYLPPLASSKGEIEVNAYGNIDVYKPHMIPMNCVLIEDSLAMKAARFIKVPFAKAVTGFEFEKGFTVKPKVSGIVCLRDFKDGVCVAIEGIKIAEQEQAAENKCVKGMDHWVTLLKKLKIQQRLNVLHGTIGEDLESEKPADVGGFLPEDRNSEQVFEQDDDDLDESAGFIHEEEDDIEEEAGFIHDDSESGGFFANDEPVDSAVVENEGDADESFSDGGFFVDEEENSAPEPNLSKENKVFDENAPDLLDEYSNFLQELESD